VKNIPALALALVCTTGFFVAPTAHAATATLTWPGTINLNLSNGVTATEDIASRSTVISLDTGNGNTKQLGKTDSFGPLTAGQNPASATEALLSASSPGLGANIAVDRFTSFSFNLPTGVTGGTGSISLAYNFDIDNTDIDKDAFLMASLSMIISHADGSVDTFTPSSSQAIGTALGKTSGLISLTFDFLAGDNAFLAAGVFSKGAPLQPAAVPVPAALPLLVSALAGVAGMSKRRRNKGAQV
jgi:hypothetical protein